MATLVALVLSCVALAASFLPAGGAHTGQTACPSLLQSSSIIGSRRMFAESAEPQQIEVHESDEHVMHSADQEHATKDREHAVTPLTCLQEAQLCRAKHPDLLRPIGAQLAHLALQGVNASSLDQLYWPRYLDMAGHDDGRDEDRPGKPRAYFQIHQGKLYLHSEALRSASNGRGSNNSYQNIARRLSSETFVRNICSLLKRYPGVPSMRLMANELDHTEDWNKLPVFVPWKVKGSMPILYPQALGVNEHGMTEEDGGDSQELKEEPAWHAKIPTAFFAGSASDQSNIFVSNYDKRNQLQKLFDLSPGMHDLLEIHVDEAKRHLFTFTEETRWKYQVVVDGTAARDSFIAYLRMHSMVLKQSSPYEQFFEPALIANHHFVEVNMSDPDPSAWDLQTKIIWARQHDAVAERIASNGASFAKQHLGTSGMQCFFLELLLQYHGLMHFNEDLPSEFASSPDICHVSED